MSPDNINLPENPKILVVRTDRIGDAVLSLPVFASLRAAWPDAHIAALTRSYTAQLYIDRDDVDKVIAFDAPTHHVPMGEFFRLRTELAAEKFDVAIALFSTFSVAALLSAARIPVRIGPATKLAQIFFTHRLKQDRSKRLRHEADHNLDLLSPLGVTRLRKAYIKTEPLLPEGFGKSEERPLVGVHPGSGGSSPNWPEANYSSLIRELFERGCDVVVTGSPGEEELAHRVIKASGVNCSIYIGREGLKPLLKLLAALDLFVAPSTGPLHMASAVGTPVVGLYSPIFVCLPQRWGPIGDGDSAIRPDVAPCKACVEEECRFFDCMSMITVEEVKTAALEKVFGKVAPR